MDQYIYNMINDNMTSTWLTLIGFILLLALFSVAPIFTPDIEKENTIDNYYKPIKRQLK